MRSRSRSVAASLSLLLVVACGYANSSGSQSTPPTSRLETVPPGAALLLVQRNLVLRTPAELDFDVTPDEAIEVRLRGYRTWRGSLGELTRTADRTYQLVLERD